MCPHGIIHSTDIIMNMILCELCALDDQIQIHIIFGAKSERESESLGCRVMENVCDESESRFKCELELDVVSSHASRLYTRAVDGKMCVRLLEK